MLGRKRRVATVALLLATALVVVACGAGGSSPPTDPGAATSEQVRTLTDIAQLQDAFNADKGSVRLVLLLSPT